MGVASDSSVPPCVLHRTVCSNSAAEPNSTVRLWVAGTSVSTGPARRHTANSLLDERMDLVFIVASLLIIPDTGAVFQKFRRVLRRGGCFLVFDYSWWVARRLGRMNPLHRHRFSTGRPAPSAGGRFHPRRPQDVRSPCRTGVDAETHALRSRSTRRLPGQQLGCRIRREGAVTCAASAVSSVSMAHRRRKVMRLR